MKLYPFISCTDTTIMTCPVRECSIWRINITCIFSFGHMWSIVYLGTCGHFALSAVNHVCLTTNDHFSIGGLYRHIYHSIYLGINDHVLYLSANKHFPFFIDYWIFFTHGNTFGNQFNFVVPWWLALMNIL